MKLIKLNHYHRKTTRNTQVTIFVILAFMLGFITLGVFLMAYIGFTRVNEPLLDPSAGKVESVQISCEDPIGYVRCKYYKGELTEKEAQTLIAIAKPESGYNPKAKNRRSTASGVFQILAGTWYHHNCIGDKWNFKDNTECAVKVLRSEGVGAWVSSRSQWIGEISKIEI